jgi:hypothetical protein
VIVKRADILLRRSPALGGTLFSNLLGAMDNPGARMQLSRLLATKPPWSNDFLMFAARSAPPGAVILLVRDLKQAGAAPTPEQNQAFIDGILRGGNFAQAYATWREMLPKPPTTVLYDGEFEGKPGPGPFNWTGQLRPRGRGGIDAKVVIGPDADSPSDTVLRLQLRGSQRWPAVIYQMTMLPPGTYRFSGAGRREDGDSSVEMAWTLACLDGRELGTAGRVLGEGLDWTTFSTVFTVPAGCDVQSLALGGVSGERRGDVTLFFDHFEIAPASAAPALPTIPGL